MLIVNDILYALAVVGAIGLISSILLALISHFFSVPQDKRERAIRDNLPGVNCGACGYKGCDDYAAAIFNGEARTNLCVPGGDDAAARIAEVLGIDAEDVIEKVAFVACNGNCEATGKKALYSGVNTCRAAALLYGGPNSCVYGCIGLGDCANVCPSDAICIKDGIAHINPKMCIGCGLCAKTCPKALISLRPEVAPVTVKCSSRDKGAEAKKLCSNACIACKMCEKNCPAGAITVIDNHAVIDYDKCTSCGLCAEKCPTKCIKNVSF